jgi:hypothetical protein
MTIVELQQLLEQTGFPVIYSHFKNQPPSIPYICCRTVGTENFFADNVIFQEVIPVDIELYTEKKDLIAEKKIKEVLQANKINYEMVPEIFINTEQLFLNTFEVELR